MAPLDFDWLEGCDGIIEVSPVSESPMLILVEFASAEQRELLECRLQLLQHKYVMRGPTSLLVVPDES